MGVPVETPESLLVILSSDEAPLELPPGSSEIDRHEPATDVSPLPRVGKVPVGRRNIALTSLAGTLRRRGCDAEEIFHHLQFINRRRCEEPLSVQELEKIASGVHDRYPPTDPVGQMDVEESPPVWSPPAADRPASLREVHDAYEKLLPGADHRALRFTLSGYSANYLEAPPLFTLLIGIPSSGKTMTLRALSELPCIQMIDHLTPASLLPGTPSGKRSGESGGGLLLKPREFRIMITEDLRGPLSMGNGPRTKLFGMLSRIYDGELERAVGTGGGLTLRWKGKRGLLGAATPAIYKHHKAVLELGPRFLFLRLNSTRRRGEQPSPEGLKADTEELARTTRRFYSTLDVLAYPEYGRSCRSYLMGLADLASSIRVPAEEGAEIPRGEMPHRLMHQLETYLRGSLVTGYSLEETLEDIREIALSTVPPGYRCLLRTLSTRGPMTQAELAKELRISAGAISKMCQRLRALKLIRRSNRRIHLELPLLQLLTTPCDNGSLEAMDELVVGE